MSYNVSHNLHIINIDTSVEHVIQCKSQPAHNHIDTSVEHVVQCKSQLAHNQHRHLGGTCHTM